MSGAGCDGVGGGGGDMMPQDMSAGGAVGGDGAGGVDAAQFAEQMAYLETQNDVDQTTSATDNLSGTLNDGGLGTMVSDMLAGSVT